MIYFVVGHKGVGKTFLFDKMRQDGDFCAYDTGPIVRALYKEDPLSAELDFSCWVEFYENKYGKNIFPQKIVDYILDSKKKNKITVIFGNRQLSAIQEMARMLKDDFLIIYLNAPNRLLKQNFEVREKNKISAKAWADLMLDEDRYGLQEIRDYVLKNSVKHLFYTKIRNDKFLSINIMYQLKRRSCNLSFPNFVYYTTNDRKKAEAEQILKNKYGLNFDFSSKHFFAPEIQASSCSEVVAFTAKYLANRLNVPVLKSDSGLFIDALGGLPGPYSAYFAKQLGEKKLLELLAKETNRKAVIEHCFAYCEPNSEPIVFCGAASGKISYDIGSKGMWLERFFIPNRFNKTLGELAVINYEREIGCWGDAINQFAIWFLQNKGKRT